MESFPFSQSVKERSVIKLHLCHRRLRCLPMHPILFRCISVLALPHGMAVVYCSALPHGMAVVYCSASILDSPPSFQLLIVAEETVNTSFFIVTLYLYE